MNKEKITDKNTLDLTDVKGVLVLVQFEDGIRQVITNRKTERAVLNICLSLSDNRKLKLNEDILEGISIEYPKDVESFTDYVKYKK